MYPYGLYKTDVGTWYLTAPQMLSFFRHKNALSEQTAVNLSSLDYLEAGLYGKNASVLENGSLRYFQFIHKTQDGKYWLNEEELEQAMSVKNPVPKWLGVGAFITIAVLTLLLLAAILSLF